MRNNFHTHTLFCDGENSPEEFVSEAVKHNMEALGFSSHAPIPFPSAWTMKAPRMPEYLTEIKRLKDKYKGKIDIYLGLEIDYMRNDTRDIFATYPLDYRIGSIHLFPDFANNKYYAVDASAEEFRVTVNGHFKGDIKECVRTYFALIGEMVEKHRPEIIGHFDVIKKNNTGNIYFSESEQWYKDAAQKALGKIAKTGSIVEINTKWLSRGITKEPCPSASILKECEKLGIPVILSADAHAPEDLNTCFPEAISILKDIGFSEQKTLRNGKWVMEKL